MAASSWGTQGPWDVLQFIRAAPTKPHFAGASETLYGPYADRIEPWQRAEDLVRAQSRYGAALEDSIYGLEGPFYWQPIDCVCDGCVGGWGGWLRFADWLGRRHALANMLAKMVEKEATPRPVTVPRGNQAHRGPRPQEETCTTALCPWKRMPPGRLCARCTRDLRRRLGLEVATGRAVRYKRSEAAKAELRALRRRLASLRGAYAKAGWPP